MKFDLKIVLELDNGGGRRYLNMIIDAETRNDAINFANLMLSPCLNERTKLIIE